MAGRKIEWDRPTGAVVLAAACSSLALLSLVSHFVGLSSRTFARSPVLEEVSSARECYAVFESAGVRGRILLLFDPEPRLTDYVYSYPTLLHLEGRGEAPVTPASLVSSLIQSGIVREVYWVVPAVDWQSTLQAISRQPNAVKVRGLPSVRFEGVPFHALTFDKLPKLEEKVLVCISDSDAAAYPSDALEAATDPSVSDLVVVWSGR